MSVELEQAKGEILKLQRELSAAKLESRMIARKPDESGALKSEVKRLQSELSEAKAEASRGVQKDRIARKSAESECDRLKSDLESAQLEIKKLKSLCKSAESDKKRMRSLFKPGPDMEKQGLRDRLKAAESELWRMKDVRDK